MLACPALHFLQSNSHSPLHAPGHLPLSSLHHSPFFPPHSCSLAFTTLPYKTKQHRALLGGLSSRASSCVNTSRPTPQSKPHVNAPLCKPQDWQDSPGTSLPRGAPVHRAAPNCCWPACAELRGGTGASPRLAGCSLDDFPPDALGHRSRQSTGVCLARCRRFHVRKHHMLKTTRKVVCLPAAWPWIPQCHQSAVRSPQASGALFLSQHTAEFPTGQLSRSPPCPAPSPATPHISSPPYLNRASLFFSLDCKISWARPPVPALNQPQGVSGLQEDFYIKSHFSR